MQTRKKTIKDDKTQTIEFQDHQLEEINFILMAQTINIIALTILNYSLAATPGK